MKESRLTCGSRVSRVAIFINVWLPCTVNVQQSWRATKVKFFTPWFLLYQCFVFSKIIFFPKEILPLVDLDATDENSIKTISTLFQIVKFVSKEVKPKKDVKTIFRVLKQTVYPDKNSSSVNVTTVMEEHRDSLINVMGQEFYTALKTNKFLTGEV